MTQLYQCSLHFLFGFFKLGWGQIAQQKCRDNLSKELSWLSTVFYLLQIAGYNFPSISNYLEIDEEITVKNLKTELQKLYRQHFFKTISLSSKLAPIYGKIKKEYREESYVSQVEYYKYRSAITTVCLLDFDRVLFQQRSAETVYRHLHHPTKNN